MDWRIFLEQRASREFEGLAGKVVETLATAIAIYHLYVFISGSYEIYVHRSIHVGSILCLCLLTYSASAKNARKFLSIDVVLALLSLIITAYLAANADRLIYQRLMFLPGSLTAWELGMGLALILMLFEASRRAMGPLLGLVTLFFLLYAYLGVHVGGILHHPGLTFAQIIDYSVFTDFGIFTMPVGVSSTYIIMFVIFAGLLWQSGATDFFRDFALALAGGLRGGPAKVAVIGSAFVGSITGSAAANVVITGSVTIPMMKSAGYKPYFAGAVEAAASTGGHILPPVMAGTVFIMAEFLGVTYWSICVAAFIPALLYFWGIFIQVHCYSIKHNVATLKRGQIPSVWKTLKGGGEHFLPFIVLVGLLAKGYSPIYAAMWSLPVIIAVSWLRRTSRIGIKKILHGLGSAVLIIRLIMLATALSGIIMGVVLSTGLGTKLMVAVGSLAEDSLALALLIVAAVSFLLGMTLSGIASYILTVILIVPATVKMGIPPLAAHLFSFYFAHLSALTPPVGATFYQAAALAHAPPFKTGWAAVRLVIAGFVVPVFFIYHPSLLLIGSLTETVIVIASATLSVACLGVALEGWLFGNLNTCQRTLIGIAAILLLVIKPLAVAVTLVILGSVAFWNWSENRRSVMM
jgi:TRAP transporter 4TM/12TM fusion protein